jgi:hypothetical protein
MPTTDSASAGSAKAAQIENTGLRVSMIQPSLRLSAHILTNRAENRNGQALILRRNIRS